MGRYLITYPAQGEESYMGMGPEGLTGPGTSPLQGEFLVTGQTVEVT